MSTIFLHVGQCGNQLGTAFWQGVADLSSKTQGLAVPSKKPSQAKSKDQCSGGSQLPFSLTDGTLPCVLVDTEPKVVRQAGKVLSARIRPENHVVERRGRGNNWAYGYYGAQCQGKPPPKSGMVFGSSESVHLKERVMECVRRLVERCDRFSGSVILHSLAGGTGSGIGSSILEPLRDEYPLAYILTVPVAPFTQGETPLQHYNTILCLSRLQSYSDMILLFQNDCVFHHTQRTVTKDLGLGASKPGSCSVSMEAMNSHIGQTLCNTLLPIWSSKQKATRTELAELTRSLCADPSLKLLTPTHTEYTKPSVTWEQALTAVSRSPQLRISDTSSKPSAVSLLLICRSEHSGIGVLVDKVSSFERKLKQAYNTVSWNPFPVDFWFSHEQQLKSSKKATLLANSSVVVDYLDTALWRARAMYREKAYLHWYTKYGCEERDFEEAFDVVQTIGDNYKKLGT